MLSILGNSYMNATRQAGYVPSHTDVQQAERAADASQPRSLSMIRRWRRRAAGKLRIARARPRARAAARGRAGRASSPCSMTTRSDSQYLEYISL